MKTNPFIRPAKFDLKESSKPWPDNFTMWLRDLAKYPDELRNIIEAAQDERPIQNYIEENPVVLSLTLSAGHGRWVFPKPKLGSEYVPDFMLCGRDSRGFHWQVVELESPRFKVLTQKGEPTARLTHARHQIDQWRIWLRKNIQYAQNELGYIHLDEKFVGVIIIGRRHMLDQRFREYYRELSNDKVRIMSYDRLIDKVVEAAKLGKGR